MTNRSLQQQKHKHIHTHTYLVLWMKNGPNNWISCDYENEFFEVYLFLSEGHITERAGEAENFFHFLGLRFPTTQMDAMDTTEVI